MNENDSKFATVSGEFSLVVDFRKVKAQIASQASMVRMLGVRHFNPEIEGLGAQMLAGNSLYVYHVESVGKKLWVVSQIVLDPAQTQEMVKKVIGVK